MNTLRDRGYKEALKNVRLPSFKTKYDENLYIAGLVKALQERSRKWIIQEIKDFRKFKVNLKDLDFKDSPILEFWYDDKEVFLATERETITLHYPLVIEGVEVKEYGWN